MHELTLLAAFAAHLLKVKTVDQLYSALEQICFDLGFRFFALSQHVDFGLGSVNGIRLHNYPRGYENWFDDRGLGVSDPVHRASYTLASWFAWSHVPDMITMTRGDEAVFRRAQREGIGDGVTVPANIPGEARGTCSFAMAVGKPIPPHIIPFVRIVGQDAFQCARRLSQPRYAGIPRIRMTDRQRECLKWWARGKTYDEVAEILGISKETVIDHLRAVQSRLGGLHTRLLMMQAVYDGALCFDDVLPTWHDSPHLWG